MPKESFRNQIFTQPIITDCYCHRSGTALAVLGSTAEPRVSTLKQAMSLKTHGGDGCVYVTNSNLSHVIKVRWAKGRSMLHPTHWSDSREEVETPLTPTNLPGSVSEIKHDFLSPPLCHTRPRHTVNGHVWQGVKIRWVSLKLSVFLATLDLRSTERNEQKMCAVKCVKICAVFPFIRLIVLRLHTHNHPLPAL